MYYAYMQNVYIYYIYARHTNTWKFILAYTRTFTHPDILSFTHHLHRRTLCVSRSLAHKHTHKHTHKHIHTHIHTHTHKRKHVHSRAQWIMVHKCHEFLFNGWQTCDGSRSGGSNGPPRPRHHSAAFGKILDWRMYTYTCIYIHIHVYTPQFICMCIYIYIHIHTCVWTAWPRQLSVKKPYVPSKNLCNLPKEPYILYIYIYILYMYTYT